ECPHRLSDKLLKSVAASAFASCREVAYITLSSFRVNLFFRSFSPAIQLPEPSDPVTVRPLFRVSGGAL
ncbi:hypothetical protein ACA373_16635, partial [Erwinia sp. STN24]|uniref:hypothetical protein n=1 Tax=Erwinia sp. STN24 TaxID=3233996 RepID=UPI0035203CF3